MWFFAVSSGLRVGSAAARPSSWTDAQPFQVCCLDKLCVCVCVGGVCPNFNLVCPLVDVHNVNEICACVPKSGGRGTGPRSAEPQTYLQQSSEKRRPSRVSQTRPTESRGGSSSSSDSLRCFRPVRTTRICVTKPADSRHVPFATISTCAPAHHVRFELEHLQL